MRAKTVNFDRDASPYEKLGLGRHTIKKALLQHPITADSMEGDAMRDWFRESPEIWSWLDYNTGDPLAFTDYYSFDEDWHLENEAPESTDYDKFQEDFKSGGRGIKAGRITLDIGKLPDGSKVIHYIDGLGSGYIAKKDWLK